MYLWAPMYLWACCGSYVPMYLQAQNWAQAAKHLHGPPSRNSNTGESTAFRTAF